MSDEKAMDDKAAKPKASTRDRKKEAADQLARRKSGSKKPESSDARSE